MRSLLEYLGMEIIVHPILFLSRILFRFVDFLWPKDSNLLVFSSDNGQKLSDNNKYLFKNFIKHYSEEFRIVWITRNKSIIHDNLLSPIERSHVVYQLSISGILTLLKAKVVFYSPGLRDIPGVSFSKKTMVIQLWHGIPVKRISGSEKRYSKWETFMSTLSNNLNYTYWISSSTIDRNSTALCVGLPIDKVIVAGYPRNDYLIEQKNSPSSEILELFPYLNKKIILYAPTFRDNRLVQFFPFENFSVNELNLFLEKNDAYLLIRGHRNDNIHEINSKLGGQLFEGGRIVNSGYDVFEDVQELLPFVDILISDYSGTWIDYLLLERPIIFVPYDLELYENERGLLYDYDLITPGPKILTSDELIKAIQQYLIEPEKDSEKRNCVKKMFHQYEDGLSYKRIYNLIKGKIDRR